MNDKITFEEIMKKIDNGDYRTKVPYPLAMMDKEERKERIKRYRLDQDRFTVQLKNDLARSFGVSDNPKLEKLWQIVWDNGHANGLYEVALIFSEYVELIQ